MRVCWAVSDGGGVGRRRLFGEGSEFSWTTPPPIACARAPTWSRAGTALVVVWQEHQPIGTANVLEGLAEALEVTLDESARLTSRPRACLVV